jgi:hypothetical protein
VVPSASAHCLAMRRQLALCLLSTVSTFLLVGADSCSRSGGGNAGGSAPPEADYKASATAISYNQLSKDPGSLAGKVVKYEAQVFQYDSATTTSNFIASVTKGEFGLWSDHIWADVDPSATGHICKDTIIRFWGTVVGAYSYTNTLNGQSTIPEINIHYADVESAGC